MGLDSFMDIVTNVIGALFFVLVYVVLSSISAKGKVVLPMVETADTERVYFECRAGTVLNPDVDGLEADLERLLTQTGEEGLSQQELVSKANAAGIRNPFYTFRLELAGGGIRRVYDMVPGSKGEPESEIAAPESQFRKALSALDPSRQHVYFIVRTDSFEVFRAARRLAAQQGLAIGWGPLAADGPFVIDPGSQGESVDHRQI